MGWLILRKRRADSMKGRRSYIRIGFDGLAKRIGCTRRTLKSTFRESLMARAVLLGALSCEAKTRILLAFEAEDYTCDRSNDAIRDVANILSLERMRGNCNVVGRLAARLVGRCASTWSC